MSEVDRVQGPSAEEIEKRLRSPVVVAARPLILGGIGVLSVVRRFGSVGRCRGAISTGASRSCVRFDTAMTGAGYRLSPAMKNS